MFISDYHALSLQKLCKAPGTLRWETWTLATAFPTTGVVDVTLVILFLLCRLVAPSNTA